MIDEALEQFIDSFLKKNLGANYSTFQSRIEDYHNTRPKFVDHIIKLNKKTVEQGDSIDEQKIKIESFEQSIRRLEALCAGLSSELKAVYTRLEKYEKAEVQAEEAAANAVIATFNVWAANPAVPFPAAFSFIAGDFRIRTTQQIIETPEESKWITNRGGGQKYLLPNPNSFNQMTVSDFLYKIIGTAKPKGQNKIRIIKPCAMTNDGFVEFSGELQILS